MTTPNELQKLERYYEIVLSHVRWSFWASLGSVVVGLSVLLAGVFMLYKKETPDPGMIATVAGVLSEFIAAGFFYIYNKNLKQLNFFYEKLVKFQDTYWAMGLVNHLEEKEKSEMLKVIISNLIIRNEPRSDMSPETIKALGDAVKKLRSF